MFCVSCRLVAVFVAGPGRPLGFVLPSDAVVVGVDGGVELAHELGYTIDLAVGDFDSLSPTALAVLEGSGTLIERHPVAKDASDLELALEVALRFEPERIIVFGGSAGRLDHLAGGLLLLAAERYAGVEVDAQLGEAAVHVIHGERLLVGSPGELVSLFAPPSFNAPTENPGDEPVDFWAVLKPSHAEHPTTPERRGAPQAAGRGRGRTATAAAKPSDTAARIHLTPFSGPGGGPLFAWLKSGRPGHCSHTVGVGAL